ncbi:MAG: hypothetical protein ABSG25_15080, partial [Bryobacteraceae bacterium]
MQGGYLMAQVNFLKWSDFDYLQQSDSVNDDLTLDSFTTTGATMNTTGITIPTTKKLTVTDLPTNPTDGVNKAYVDSIIGSPDYTIYTSTQANIGLKVVRISGNNLVSMAQADSATDISAIIGICIDNLAANTNIRIQTNGAVTGILTGATAGIPYYLSDTSAGGLTAIAPTTKGHYSVPIGY